ncbi:S-adenosyl-L-methionine-dependent methyltransferase [Hypoxylon sp. FL1284]|nr:S-adenosyl-L-methionine-dependent methyltransferase [Hypoxylon sp. FL1284]
MDKEAKRKGKKVRKRDRAMINVSPEKILAIDVQNLIESLSDAEDADAEDADEGSAESKADGLEGSKRGKLPIPGSEIEVDVVELSSTGDGLALQKGSNHVYVVPFSVPGDTVKVKVYRQPKDENYTNADFISVVKPSASRDDSRAQCKYFGTCSGCQFQMLDYSHQLQLKKRIVEKAFRHFSQLPPELVPAVGDTIGSPLQYGYRTKLTPHFDGPLSHNRKRQPLQSCPPVGFMAKGKRRTIDIEDCPIGTDAVRLGMKTERRRMSVEYGKYTRGATILLRESTKRIWKDAAGADVPKFPEETSMAGRILSTPPEDQSIRVETDEYTDLKTCVTDNNATSTEYVGRFGFQNPAGAFFQNNNSILPVFTDYIREHILPPSPPPSSSTDPAADPSSSSPPQIEYLIDAYSGSGLFTITLASLFPGGSVGVDIAGASIAYASRNAAANGLTSPSSSSSSPGDEDRARFLAADANRLFEADPRARRAPDRTAVVVDPPRKGCDAAFLRQLLRFGPRRVVYVSCNVHTQARDVGVLVRGDLAGSGLEEDDRERASAKEAEEPEGDRKVRYAIESLRGFDFFPQTGHVEGVAVLNRVDD